MIYDYNYINSFKKGNGGNVFYRRLRPKRRMDMQGRDLSAILDEEDDFGGAVLALGKSGYMPPSFE